MKWESDMRSRIGVRRRFASAVLCAFLMQIFSMASPTGWFSSPMAAAGWDGAVATEFTAGTGASENPFEISTPEELAFLAQEVNKGNAKYTDTAACYKLTAPIYLSGEHKWTPIGVTNDPDKNFRGTFDGNGHTIHGMQITSGDYAYAYAGLFGCVNGATIKEVAVTDFVVSVDVSCTAYAGGLVAYMGNDSTIASSSASGDVSVSASSNASAYAGGLVGYVSESDVADSYAAVDVESFAASTGNDGYAGGLVGMYDSGHSIKKSYSYGSVSGDIAGGLIGQRNSGQVINCYWRQDEASSGVNASLALGIHTDSGTPPLDQSANARNLDVAGFQLADADKVIVGNWDFGTTPNSEGIWCYITVDNGLRPHLRVLVAPGDILWPKPENTTPPGGGDNGGGTPSKPDNTLGDATLSFNEENQDAGVRVVFPDVPIANPDEVAAQFGGLRPVIVTDTTVKNVVLTPSNGSSQAGAQGLTGLGAGWGAKIEVQLKVTPKDGEILMLPVELTFSLTQADLAEAGLTAGLVANDVSALLAEAIFAKFPAEGDSKDKMQDLTDLIKSVLTITKTADGGISIGLPFLLANGKGDPKLVTDGVKTHLVIFDGDRNNYLRDPIYLFRKPEAFAVASLVANPSSPKSGDTVSLTAMFSAAADEATITVTPPGGTAQNLTTTLAANKLSATAPFKADTAGVYTAKATAKAAMSTETLEITVTVKDEDKKEEDKTEEQTSSSGGGCGNTGVGTALVLLALAGAAIRRRR